MQPREQRERIRRRWLLGGIAVLGLSACEAPSNPSSSEPAIGRAEGVALAMSDDAWDALPVDAQYRVANKLMATLYTGLPVDAFYTLEAGNALRERTDPGMTLSSLRTALQTSLPPSERLDLDARITGERVGGAPEGEDAEEAMFRFDDQRARQLPIARLHAYPFGRDRFTQWMAWHLANTILFSPAEEIDSADMTDVQNLFRRLEIGVRTGTDLRAMIATHQRSLQNWRRFRSPEDNTREMMEIYLGLFDNDEQVPLASQACRDLYLTDESNGYQLARTDYPNTEPVEVLGQRIVTCDEFYDLVAGHPLVIPRVTAILVDHFLAGSDVSQRLALTEAIAATGPRTFEDIFLAILFSEAYLMDSERTASFEESFLAMAARLKWEAHPDMPRGLASGRGSLARADMAQMGWPAMSLKLGRNAAVPLDSLSFGNYHKALREHLMLDAVRWRTPLALELPKAPQPAPPVEPDVDAPPRERQAFEEERLAYEQAVADLTPEEREAHVLERDEWLALHERHRRIDDLTIHELIDYVMLAGVQRRSTEQERQVLIPLLAQSGHLDDQLGNRFARRGRHDDIAAIVLDYASRLPETYHLLAQRSPPLQAASPLPTSTPGAR